MEMVSRRPIQRSKVTYIDSQTGESKVAWVTPGKGKQLTIPNIIDWALRRDNGDSRPPQD